MSHKYRKSGGMSLSREDQSSLESLIHRYLDKSDELENKEGRVLKQMELMQSAVASLQGWQQKRSSRSTSQPVPVNVQQIEEETRQIQAETLRIQNEVQQKIEDNKKLQEKLDQKRMIEKRLKEMVPDDLATAVEREKQRKSKIEEIESTYSDLSPSAPTTDEDSDSMANEDPNLLEDSRVRFFHEKIRQLKAMEKKLMKESKEDARIAKAQRENLREKIEMLEWEAEIDRQLVKSLKRKYLQE